MLSAAETRNVYEKLRQLVSKWSESILPNVRKYAEVNRISLPEQASSTVSIFRKIAQHFESKAEITVFALVIKRIVSRRYLEKISDLQGIDLYACLEDFLLLLEAMEIQTLRIELSKDICQLLVLPPPHPSLPLISPIPHLYLATLKLDSELIANYLFSHITAYSNQLKANPNDTSPCGPIWQICTLVVCHPALPIEIRIRGYQSRVAFDFANATKSMDDLETLHLLLHQYQKLFAPKELATMKSFLKEREAERALPPGTPADASVPRGYISFSFTKFYDEALRKFATEFVKRTAFVRRANEDPAQMFAAAALASARAAEEEEAAAEAKGQKSSSAIPEEEKIAAQRLVGIWLAFGSNGVDLDLPRARKYLERSSPGDSRGILDFASQLLAFEAQNKFDRTRKDLAARIERYITSCRDDTVYSGRMCCSKGCAAPNAKFRCPCSMVYYCSKKCQQEHWPEHKSKCDAKNKKPVSN